MFVLFLCVFFLTVSCHPECWLLTAPIYLLLSLLSVILSFFLSLHTSCASRKLADCPQLLDVDDMVRLREPDWKCVYTYLQEFYRGLVQKGLVKTKNSL